LKVQFFRLRQVVGSFEVQSWMEGAYGRPNHPSSFLANARADAPRREQASAHCHAFFFLHLFYLLPSP
jgi:hypothetical protein